MVDIKEDVIAEIAALKQQLLKSEAKLTMWMFIFSIGQIVVFAGSLEYLINAKG